MCEEAEHLGAHSVWVTEHHLFEDGYVNQPLTFAAAIAARTRRVRIGTAILIAPFRPAIQIAEEAAVVDILSRGRLELGLGAGYRVPEFDLFGADIKNRYVTTDRRVSEIRSIWADARHVPSPVQDPVPIWLGYAGPQGARRAGRLGAGLLVARPDLVEPYCRGLEEGGHSAGAARMAGVLGGFVSDDPERDWPEVSKHLSYQWDSYRRYMVEGTGQPDPPPIDPDRWRQRGFSGAGYDGFGYGTADEVAAAILQFTAGTPIETLIFWASLAGMSESMVARHVGNVCMVGKILSR